MSISCETALNTRLHWWLVKIGSGNDLVPSSNKPLPGPMSTKFYDGIWWQLAIMSQPLSSGIYFRKHSNIFIFSVTSEKLKWGTKPLNESMINYFGKHKDISVFSIIHQNWDKAACHYLRQWWPTQHKVSVNSLRPSDDIWCHESWTISTQVMACHPWGAKLLSLEPMMIYCQLSLKEQFSFQILIKI